MSKTILLWILALVITLAAAVYQRLTGPTYAQEVKVVIDGQDYNLELTTSHSVDKKCYLNFEIPSDDISGKLIYRRFPTNDKWTEVELLRQEDKLVAELPLQPPAGKLEYYIDLQKGDESVTAPADHPVVIRFKGAVPRWVLRPHIFFMFFAMLISNLTGLMALSKHQKQKLYGVITLFLLIIGGLILGPVVQKFAFGDLWTGVPFGWDLTDNKTLIAFLFWLVAVLGNRKKERPGLTILAAFMMLVIFSIPHSMFGSELNYETGEMIQGMIMLY